ncbi:ERO1 family protein, partial [Salmonella enterica subsp. enterica serovar Oranienburg]|nr:ERO1 family protein [Salmonella enterica subsp. enterica serovar Oranienburg]
LAEMIPIAKLASDESEQLLLANKDAAIRDEYSLLVSQVVSKLGENELFDTSSLFKNVPTLKEEFRARFKNVSAIMDCVG